MELNKKKILLKTLLVLATISLGIFIYFNRSTTGNTSSNSSFSLTTYLPLYVAIFIPLIINQKRKQEQGEDIDKRKVLITFFGLCVLVSIGILIYRIIN